MIFTLTRLEGALLIDIERREDERGYFALARNSPRLEQCAASISMVVDLSPTHAAIFDCKLRSDLNMSFGIKEDDMARKRYIAAKLRQVDVLVG